MNKKRTLYLLFDVAKGFNTVNGYTLIHKHTAMNDEPPYKMCSFWDKGFKKCYEEDGESMLYYQIRTSDTNEFINWLNNLERDYLDDIYQLTVENGYDDNPKPLKSAEIEEIANSDKWKRMPKIKYMHCIPNPNMPSFKERNRLNGIITNI